MAILNNFLREPKPNELAHSNVSALLVTNPGLLDWALFMAEATATGAAKLVEATEKWGTTESKTQTAFNIARNTELPFFDYLSQTPELRKKFAMYMKNVTASEGTKIEHLANGYDWASLGEATVVDVCINFLSYNGCHIETHLLICFSHHSSAGPTATRPSLSQPPFLNSDSSFKTFPTPSPLLKIPSPRPLPLSVTASPAKLTTSLQPSPSLVRTSTSSA